MERDTRPELGDLPTPSPQLSRTQSRTSDGDRTPSISGSAFVQPPSVSPEPAYIAPSAAAHVINTELASRGQDFMGDEDVDEETAAAVSAPALALINAFLDQLLFSFLASSRSTSLISLRPAISDILKPRLANQAIKGADEELQGYLTGGDDEELLDFHNGQELKGGIDLHQIFKRTRLRCMVYTRLGDMEEEDEEAHLEGESPPEDERHRLSRDLGNVSPAAAIFLTAVIEFIGEQALVVAGDNAVHRTAPKRNDVGRLIVEDRDVEKIAFNKTLGRLWRSFKRRGRASGIISLRPPLHEHYSQTKSVSERASRATSISENGESSYFVHDHSGQSSKDRHWPKSHDPRADVPPKEMNLPDEPDFGSDSENAQPSKPSHERPRSMSELPWNKKNDDLANGIRDAGAEGVPLDLSEKRPMNSHQRSSSLPVFRYTPYSSPVDEAFTTPTEGPDPLLDSEAQHKAQEELPRLTDDSKRISDLAIGSPGVSSMYDGVLKRDSKPIPIDPSLINERASHTEDAGHSHDADMTPQALNFRKSPTKTRDDVVAEQTSRASSMSSNYSFQAGKQSPLSSPNNSTRAVTEQSDEENEVFPARGISLEQARVEPGNLSKLKTVQGDRLKSYDQSGKAVKRDVPVFDEEPSEDDVIYNSGTSTIIPEDEEALSTPTITNSKDIAHASLFQYGDLPPAGVPQNQPSTAAAELIDMRKLPVGNEAGTERAAVQRVLSSSAVSRETPALDGRVSTSSNREGRPVTAASTTSQISTKIKGIVRRESGDAMRPPIPRNTSSEIRREITAASSRSGVSDKEQDFEQLMRSDETIQYTLTPQNMREIEQPNSPRWSSKPPPSGVEQLADTQRSEPSSGSPHNKSIPATRSIKSLRGLNGLRSNPTQGSDVMEFASPVAPSPQPSSTSPRSQSHTAPKPMRENSKGIVARGPTNQDDNTRDFADFIRSTGPDADAKIMARSTSGRSPVYSRVENGIPQQEDKRVSKKITKASPVIAPKKPESTMPSRSGSKLMARDPIASPKSTTHELADFFRSGPPGAHVTSQGIPSPQHSPQQFGKMRDGIGSGISVASTQDSFAPSKMTQSSSNSRTGLLDTTNRARQGGSDGPAAHLDDPPGPIRKQWRVKDPYAIDSDEEDNQYGNPPEPERREEESLSDFLRNYTPPPTSGSERAVRTSSASPTDPGSSLNQRKSSVSIKERLARNIAVIPDYRPLPPKTPKNKSISKSPPQSDESRHKQQSQRSPKNTANSRSPTSKPELSRSTATITQVPQTRSNAPQLPPFNAVNTPRATSPHLIQNGKKMDSYRPSQPTYAKHMDRRPKQHLQARDAGDANRGGGASSGMADLADFLRQTEPPAPSGPIASAGGVNGNGARKERVEGGWVRMFGRKKSRA